MDSQEERWRSREMSIGRGLGIGGSVRRVTCFVVVVVVNFFVCLAAQQQQSVPEG